MTDDLRFPTGKFSRPGSYDAAARATYIDAIARTPNDLRTAVSGLTSNQLDEPYRPGGWTVRQVVHHVPDSHMNAYMRFKLALTEDAPVIKPYDEARWAELEDSRTTPIETSLALLAAVHDRWVRILRAMSAADFAREYTHPEMGRNPLDFMLALYAWHGPHHVAHVTALKTMRGW
ncbi:MAG: putative metal-dependent hydrolase [Cytophagaceae bacterium]|nr:putative metal-dependent hydrolase [Gemmatimonadaceae bacterium]